MREITDEQAKEAITNGRFGDDIVKSGSSVAVILTQGWCSQWHTMSAYLETFENTDNIFFYLYDRSPLFEDFIQFKESVFKNEHVPLCLFYKNGVEDESKRCNYVMKGDFSARLL